MIKVEETGDGGREGKGGSRKWESEREEMDGKRQE